MTDKTAIWTPRLLDNDTGWENKYNPMTETIEEVNSEEKDLTKSADYKYVFARRNRVDKEECEFIGLFYIDKKCSENSKRVWRKYNKEYVTLNIEELEKELDSNI